MPKKRRNPRGHQPPKRFTNPPAVSKVLQKSHLDITKWEVEKLNYNLDIQAIPYNSRLSHLLPGYIPTLTALEEIALTSAFVAFDTEYVIDSPLLPRLAVFGLWFSCACPGPCTSLTLIVATNSYFGQVGPPLLQDY
jgi:hypothetical protein